VEWLKASAALSAMRQFSTSSCAFCATSRPSSMSKSAAASRTAHKRHGQATGVLVLYKATQLDTSSRSCSINGQESDRFGSWQDWLQGQLQAAVTADTCTTSFSAALT
jgi:hypothetical protein